MISIFDLFTIGIGPSSSHTVGPMRACRLFLDELKKRKLFPIINQINVELYGSLALTGEGHGTTKAVAVGLCGHTPEELAPELMPEILKEIKQSEHLLLDGKKKIRFSIKENIKLKKTEVLPYHPNGMKFEARDAKGKIIAAKILYSIGGGFVVEEQAARADKLKAHSVKVPYPFESADDLLKIAKKHNMRISDIVFANEKKWRKEKEINAKLDLIWKTMHDCVERGRNQKGVLPGKLKIKRRAPVLYQKLLSARETCLRDPLSILDWVTLYALAVNEENAAYGRVVTAPTNGAAGIVPAVLCYFERFCEHKKDLGIREFLLTAGAIGILYKKNASISGAEVGCQGEVGVACSMAAAGLAEVLGGGPEHVENAAEIAMEHNLGLTCDPVGGLVQIPCIERNAMGAVKAINAARIALKGDGKHFVSLDKVMLTMRQTGIDMQCKYKETSQGGLAVNVTEC